MPSACRVCDTVGLMVGHQVIVQVEHRAAGGCFKQKGARSPAAVSDGDLDFGFRQRIALDRAELDFQIERVDLLRDQGQQPRSSQLQVQVNLADVLYAGLFGIDEATMVWRISNCCPQAT